VLLASGTATLEGLLLQRPMVVAYKVSPITAWIVRRMVKVAYFSQPNLLAGQALVKEFFQAAATVDNLGPAVLELLDDPEAGARQTAAFAAIHRQLRRDASTQAAAAIAELLERTGRGK
nr:lipid-A-disaccharide synthase [Pseudomonadota bacterium]